MPTRTPIYKHVWQLVVLSESPDLSNMDDLGTLASAIAEGEDIGDWIYQGIERIDNPERVRQELIALANDGTFFDVESEDEPLSD